MGHRQSPTLLVAALLATSLGCGYIDNPRLADGETMASEESSDASDSGTGADSSSTDAATQSSDDPGDSSGGSEESCPLGSLACPCLDDTCDEGLSCVGGLCADVPICGDGLVEAPEQCDDGNLDGADGCDTDCKVTRIQAIAAGALHTCVHTTGLEVLCFGMNNYGQLGYNHETNIGDNEAPGSFGAVQLPEPATAIAAGGYNSCALLQSGAVLCWGRNTSGQLGQGNTVDLSGVEGVPSELTPIDMGEPIEQVVVGGAFICAKANSTVYCWGEGSSGQLGNGNAVDIGDSELPSSLNSLVATSPATSIAAGASHACAALVGGGLQCWGTGLNGRLGYGNNETIGDDELPSSQEPFQPDAAFTQVALGGQHSLALNSQLGDLWGVGSSNQGQLGTGIASNYGDGLGPSYATAGLESEVTGVAAGNTHSCALLDDGRVSCFGSGGFGQLGYGSNNDIGDNESVTSYAPLAFDSPVVDVATGDNHSCALLEGGELHCWGANNYGQIGHVGVANIGIDERADAAPPVTLFD